MFAVGIRNENLPEIIACYQFDDLLHARSIQFIKNIIEQQQRNRSTCPFQKVELRQLQSHQIRFVLPLRTLPLDREITQQHIQFVFMYAAQGKSHNLIARTALFQHFQQGSLTGMRIISQPDFLLVL